MRTCWWSRTVPRCVMSTDMIKITPGRIALLCCPETDFDISMKLFKIIELNEICERKVK